MFDISAKDVILLFAGALIALPTTGLWQTIKNWTILRNKASQQQEIDWKIRISSDQESIKQDAFREIIARSIHPFIMGNLIMAASGMAWFADAFALYPFQSLFAATLSLLSLVYFVQSIKWIRRYLSTLPQ